MGLDSFTVFELLGILSGATALSVVAIGIAMHFFGCDAFNDWRRQ